MPEKFSHRVSLVGLLVLTWAGSSLALDPGLVGLWKLDEVSGTTAVDSAGGDNNGTLNGTGLNWLPAAGQLGGCLESTTAGSYVQFSTTGMSATTGTVALWMYLSTSQSADTRYAFGHSTLPLWSNRIQIYMDGGTTDLDFGIGGVHALATNVVKLDTERWYHVALTWDNGSYTACVDGQVLRNGSYSGLTALQTFADFGNNGGDRSQVYFGRLDDVRLYNQALTDSKIRVIMKGDNADVASNPSPADKAQDVPRDAAVAWMSGQSATTHDVYFGTAFSDVNSASRTSPLGSLASQGQAANTFDPAGLLAFGQTYYWRVDEVNAPPTDSTIFKGEVWSFTAETFGYAVKPAKATASSMLSASMGPEKTIDGSGLDSLDQHSTSASTMWLSKKGVSPIWIQYEFDKVYKLHQMWVWNSNQAVEPSVGFGAKEVAVQTSLDGSTWTTLAGVTEFNQATGEPNYVANTIVDFAGIQAKFVKITITTNWADGAKQAGLAEVRFFYVPVKAFGPTPAHAAANVAINSVLNWRPGREAVKHEVYLSADASAIAGGTVPAKVVTEHSLALGTLALEYSKTYTWKVNEVNDAATPRAWEGDLWTFTTPDYGVVDDFESYNDTCNRVFFGWVDGFGHNGSTDCGVAPSLGNGSGSIVGNANPPFAERTIVHGGRQSMPLAYDNTTGRSFSEATRTFEPGQDWTSGGAKTLVLYFRGISENGSGQLYVKINGTQVDYPGPASSVSIGLWKQWSIDLASVGASLKAVKTLAIGVAGSAKGTLYIDDIQLYRVAPAVIQPSDPGTNGLAALYRMEADVKDSSGKGNQGTAMGNPIYVNSLAGYGQAIQFEGVDDYVDLPIGTLVSTLTSCTVGAWVNFANPSTGGWERIFDFGSGTTNYMFLAPRQGVGGPLTFAIMTSTVAEKRFTAANTLGTGWHYVAVAIDGAAMNVKVYVDGSVVADDSTTALAKDLGKTTQNWLGRSQFTADAYYNGSLDEVRIYSRALSAGEVRFLAGDR